MTSSEFDDQISKGDLSDYYGIARTEISPLLPENASSVLEIGCGAGATLRYLRAKWPASRLYGVELFEDAATLTRPFCDEVWCGNIENMDIDLLPHDLDVILCLDVLEHLMDPWSVVRVLSRHLRPGGLLIASIPNIRHFSAMLPLLLSGRWDYVEAGILDRTHLRFFTRRSAIALLEQTGMRVSKVIATGLEPGRKTTLANTLTFSVFRPFFEFQYLIQATKP